MKDFNEVWADIVAVVKKHKVLYAPESRKMQVINDVTSNSISYTDDPTHKPTPVSIKAEEFSKVWKAMCESGVIDENGMRELVGLKKAEFIWTVMDRLEYIDYDQRIMKIK